MPRFIVKHYSVSLSPNGGHTEKLEGVYEVAAPTRAQAAAKVRKVRGVPPNTAYLTVGRFNTTNIPAVTL